MPVVTRSQARRFQEEQKQLQEKLQQDKLVYNEKKMEFLDKTKLLLHANEIAKDQKSKIITAINVMKSINTYLPELLRYNEFSRFCLCVYNKVLDIQTDYTTTNGWPDIEPAITNSLINECNIAKQIVANYANTCNIINEWICVLRLKLKLCELSVM